MSEEIQSEAYISGRGAHLWPNLFVLELAPTTAKKGDAKNVLMDASVDMVGGVGADNIEGIRLLRMRWLVSCR